MRKKLLSLILFVFGVSALSAGPRNRGSDLHQLLAMHQTEMRSFFAGMNTPNGTIPAFFCDVSFTSDRQVERFLRTVSSSSGNQQVYSQSSFTQFVSINGNMRSVSYSLVNNGGNVTFVKSANINGQVLKAVYEYDPQSRHLKTGTFNGNKLLKNSDYSI
jgi:hypothetical protein